MRTTTRIAGATFAAAASLALAVGPAFAADSWAIRVICAAKLWGGKVEVSGRPPASEITSGRAVIAIRSRIADDRMTLVRCANSPA